MADGAASFRRGVSDPALLRIPLPSASLPARGSHPLWPAFPDRYSRVAESDGVVLQPRSGRNHPGLGSSAFARHYLRNHCYFLLLRVLRCFSSPRSLLQKMQMTGLQPDGLPHSDTCGSPRMCRSPQLFAAYRVLLRLRKPRHPPCALTHFQSRAATIT